MVQDLDQQSLVSPAAGSEEDDLKQACNLLVEPGTVVHVQNKLYRVKSRSFVAVFALTTPS